MAWNDEASCKGHDPGDWFANPLDTDPAERERHRIAKAICETCPVRAECAVRGRREPGMWGGVYRTSKTAQAITAETRCGRCGGVFVREPGQRDRVCDSCLRPDELFTRRATRLRRELRDRERVDA